MVVISPEKHHGGEATGVEWITFYNNLNALFASHQVDPDPFWKNPIHWINEMDGFRLVDWFHPHPMGQHELTTDLLETQKTTERTNPYGTHKPRCCS